MHKNAATTTPDLLQSSMPLVRYRQTLVSDILVPGIVLKGWGSTCRHTTCLCIPPTTPVLHEHYGLTIFSFSTGAGVRGAYYELHEYNGRIMNSWSTISVTTGLFLKRKVIVQPYPNGVYERLPNTNKDYN